MSSAALVTFPADDSPARRRVNPRIHLGMGSNPRRPASDTDCSLFLLDYKFVGCFLVTAFCFFFIIFPLLFDENVVTTRMNYYVGEIVTHDGYTVPVIIS